MPTFTVRRLLAAGMAIASAFTVFTLLPTAAASADPSADSWYKVRMCESSNNYAINTGNGYFGAYQFDQATWTSVGGTGRPDQNDPAEQDYRALYLYRMRGWQPWTCGAGLPSDSYANSGRVPNYADSKYMGGSGKPGAPTFTPPTTKPPTPPAAQRPSTPPPPPTGVPLPPVPLPSLPTFPPIDWTIPPAGSGALVEPPIPLLTIADGTCSPVLTLWQQQMNTYGYTLGESGCNDGATRNAAQQLQYANGIRQTSNIGPFTLVAAYLGRRPH